MPMNVALKPFKRSLRRLEQDSRPTRRGHQSTSQRMSSYIKSNSSIRLHLMTRRRRIST